MATYPRLWAATFATGALLLVVSAFVIPMFPTTGANLASGYGMPVIAFELARDIEDLEAVFGSEDNPARVDRIAAMDRGNRWDYALMTFYGLFLAAFCLAIARERSRPEWIFLAGTAILASVADAYENAILLQVTKDLNNIATLAQLPYPVLMKFCALMIVGVAAGAYLITERRWRIAGVFTVIGALAVLPGLAVPKYFGWLLGSGLGFGWIVMWVYAARKTFGYRRGNVM